MSRRHPSDLADPRDIRIADLEEQVEGLTSLLTSRDRLGARRERYARAMRWLAGRMSDYRLMLGFRCIGFEALSDDAIEDLWRVMVQHAIDRGHSPLWRKITLDQAMTRLERRRVVRQRVIRRSIRLEMRRTVGGGRAAARAWIRGDAP